MSSRSAGLALTILTINILSDLSRWQERREWLVRELAEWSPDLLALQEVSLKAGVADGLAGELGYDHLFLSPKTGIQPEEGIALLSRLPIETAETLPLPGQDRVVQILRVRWGGHAMVVANGHFYWQPGESTARLRQVERLLARLAEEPAGRPVVACGDFNSRPDTLSIQRIKAGFRSAYEAIHGREPDFTTPTPLPVSKKHMLSVGLRFWKELRLAGLLRSRRQTLDYIFVNPAVRVLDCRLVLDRPAPGRPDLYPSDHFGLLATLQIE